MKPTGRYSNDRKAPRMRKAKFSTQIISKELWSSFREQFPEYKNLPDKDLGKIWEDIASLIREESVKNPLGVKLGSYTGELKLQYLPYKFEAADNILSNELGEEVKLLNLLTRGKIAKVKWERRWAVKFNSMLQFFAFDPTRKINELAKKHTDANPDNLRVSRNTLGGKSVWRNIK